MLLRCVSLLVVLFVLLDKQFGNIVVPTYSNKVGISTARRLETVYDTAFVEGDPVIANIR